MLWFNFILGLEYIFLCFKLIIIQYHTPKQRKIKSKPRIKLNHNTYNAIAFLAARLLEKRVTKISRERWQTRRARNITYARYAWLYETLVVSFSLKIKS